MNWFIPVTILLTATLMGCGAEDGARDNLASADMRSESGAQEPSNHQLGALDAPMSSPPKDAPRLIRYIPVKMGRFVEWNYRDNLKPVGYKMGDMTVIVRGPEYPAQDYSGFASEPVIRQVRVKAPGRPEYVMEGPVEAGFPTLLRHGRFDRAGTPYLLMHTETAGNHCCGEYEIFLLRPTHIEHVEVDMDASHGKPDVRDVDGDGLVDFILTDPAFQGRFTGLASGREPPRVLNVIDGKVRDVSARPGFRPLFAKAAREFRRECLHPDGIEPNGACAAYVAAAGRAGDFKRAWAEIVEIYDPQNSSGVGSACRITSAKKQICPEDERSDPTYPEELLGFLANRGFPTE
jgi:hypothetical protein